MMKTDGRMVNLLCCYSSISSAFLLLPLASILYDQHFVLFLFYPEPKDAANNSMSCSNKLVYSSHYGINGDKQFFSSLFGWCAHTNAHIWYLRIYYKKEKYVYCHHLLVIFWLFNALAQQHHIVSRRRNEPKKKRNETETWGTYHARKAARWNETFRFLSIEYHHFRNRFGSAYQIWLCWQLGPFMKKSYLFDCVCVFVFSENHFFIIFLTYQMFARSTMCTTMLTFSHISVWLHMCMCMSVWLGKSHIIPHQDLILKTQSFIQQHIHDNILIYIYAHTPARHKCEKIVERKLYGDASFKSQTTQNESPLKWRTMSSARRSCTRTESQAKPHTFT